jgi:hypothetical protein
MTRDVTQTMLESTALTEEIFHFRALQSWARCEDFALSWFASRRLSHPGQPGSTLTMAGPRKQP